MNFYRLKSQMIPAIASLLLATFFVASSFAADHSATCPRKCATCAEVVKKSLDWLATQQNAEGCWTGRNGSDLTNTAFAVLAFHANGSNVKDGPYAPNIKKAVDYFLKVVPRNEHQRVNSLTKGLKMPLHNWETAFVALAMAEVYAHHPEARYKEFLVWLIDLMCKNQSDGGWGHLSLRYGIKADVTMYGSFISPTQWNMAALGILRNLGFEVNDDVFKRGVIFLRSGIRDTGGVMYYGSLTKRTDVEAGRTALMIWALERVGAQDDIAYPRLPKYFVPNMKKTPFCHAATILHFLSGAMASKVLGEPAKSQYWKMWRDRMLAERSPEGYFVNRQLKGARWWAELMSGDNLSAAMYPLIFQLDSPHLKTWFNLKIRPFPVKNPQELIARRFPDAAKSGSQLQQTAQPPITSPPPPHIQNRSSVVPKVGDVLLPQTPKPISSGEFGAVVEEIASGGLLIVAVAEEGLAADAGLEAGDIITRLNDQLLKSVEQFKQSVNKAKDDAILTLEFSRQGKISTVKIRR